MPGNLRAEANEIIVEVFAVVKGEAQLRELEEAPGLAVHSQYPPDLDASGWAGTLPSLP